MVNRLHITNLLDKSMHSALNKYVIGVFSYNFTVAFSVCSIVTVFVPVVEGIHKKYYVYELEQLVQWLYLARIGLICMASFIANLPKGPPISNSLRSQKWKFASEWRAIHHRVIPKKSTGKSFVIKRTNETSMKWIVQGAVNGCEFQLDDRAPPTSEQSHETSAAYHSRMCTTPERRNVCG